MLAICTAAVAAAEGKLVLHYTFEGGVGTTAIDKSGNGHVGQVHGAQRVKVGEGYALRFDGLDDYVELADSPDVRFQVFTLELWMKPESAPARVPLVGKGYDDSASSYLLEVMPQGKGIYCSVLDEAGPTAHGLDSVRPLRLADKWSHVVFTCDRRWVRGYVDGLLEVLLPLGTLPLERDITIPYADKPLEIGRSISLGKWRYFKGQIAELRVYNRVLSSAEIKKDYLKGNPVLAAGERPAAPRKEAAAEPTEKAAAGRGPKLYLVKDGKPVSTIVVPAEAKYWTTVAAEWLRDYLRKATGAELEIVSEETAPSGTLISVGHTELAAKAGIGVEDLKWDGCKLAVKGDVLYLIGRNVSDLWQKPEAKISDGNCRAVVTFLEEFCGVRWFLPGPEGEFIPKARDVTVPKGVMKSMIPAIAFSDGCFPYGTEGRWRDNITPAAVANNYRKGIAATAGGASYYAMVPSGIGPHSQSGNYFETNPEYFALIDGKRTGNGNHLCSTNPDVKQLLVRGVRETFDKGYDVVTLGQEDGYHRCQCAECEKLDDYRMGSLGISWEKFQDNILRDTPAERLFLLHKGVIDEVRKTHPDGIVLLHSYGPTTWPSKVVTDWGDKVWVELSKQEPEVVEAWKGQAAGYSGYVYWFCTSIPMGMLVHATPNEVAENMRYLHENGFVGLYHFPETNFGFQGPSIYLLGRLMGDPYQDHRGVVEEYCSGVFGKAGRSMLRFFDLLYAVYEERLPYQLRSLSANPRQWDWLIPADMYLLLYPPETLAQLEEILEQAEREADTEQNRGWVKHTREWFDFTRLVTEAVTAHRVYQREKTKENWLDMKSRVEAFEEYRARIVGYDKAYTDRWFPGHWAFCNWITADLLHENVYYMPWEKRKAEVLREGLKGKALGYGGDGWRGWIKEPFDLDFSKEPEGITN